MEYEFSELEHFVTVLISPAHLKNNLLTQEVFNQYAANCYTEIENIKKKFICAVIRESDEKRATAYIHQHQACLIRFADTIYKWLMADELHHTAHAGHVKNVLVFYQEVYKDMAGLLLFLETNFSRYFDLDAILTSGCHEEFAKHVERNLAKINDVLITSGVNKDLIKILRDPLDSLQASTVAITYRMRNYLHILLGEILNLTINKGGITGENLIDLLLSSNYNHSRFFNYLIVQFDDSANKINEMGELFEFYLVKMKNLNQLVVKRDLAYDIHCIDIRQTYNWLSEEIYFLE